VIGFQKFPIVDVVMLVVYGKSSIGVNVGDRWLKSVYVCISMFGRGCWSSKIEEILNNGHVDVARY
jgi:hypothetical protein